MKGGCQPFRLEGILSNIKQCYYLLRYCRLKAIKQNLAVLGSLKLGLQSLCARSVKAIMLTEGYVVQFVVAGSVQSAIRKTKTALKSLWSVHIKHC